MIVVTGATGTVGRELVRLLSTRGAAVRALTRDARGRRARPGVEWVEADLAARERLPAALEGAESLFLLTGNGNVAINYTSGVQVAKPWVKLME